MSEFFKTLESRLFDRYRYAVIDAVWREDLPTQWPLTAIAPAFLGKDTARCPVLLDMQSLPQNERCELLGHLTQQVDDRQDALCSLLLASQCDRQALAHHLSQRMVVNLPSATQRLQFRFFDPGTFLQLPGLLGPQGMSWLFGPITAALVPWAGGWSSFEAPLLGSGGFSLKALHLAALTRMGVVNRLSLQMPPPTDAPDWTARCAAIDSHVERGMTKQGLRHQADLLAFAGHAVSHHHSFDSHPQLVALFEALRQATPDDELDYRELSSRITPTDWQRIVTDLGSAETSNSPPGRLQD